MTDIVECFFNETKKHRGRCVILSDGAEVQCGCNDTADAVKRCRFYAEKEVDLRAQ